MTEVVDSRAGPIVVGGTAYVGTRSRVYAIDAATGTELWTAPVGRQTFVTGVARWRHLVYATDIFRHAIFALDAATGTQVWSLSSQVGTSGPTVIGDILLFEDFYQLRAVEAATGDPIWTAQLDDTSNSFPALRGGTLYVGGTGGAKLYAIDFDTGAVLWSFQGQGAIEGSIALRQGTAFYGTDLTGSPAHANVYAVDLQTHAVLWRAEVGDQVVATPAVAGGLVYVNSYDGYLYAFHARNGSVAWSAHVGRSSAAPTVANGVVYADGTDGLVLAFDAATGQLLWSHRASPTVPGKIAVADGVVYFGSGSSLYALAIP